LPKMPAPGGVNANLFALLDDDDDDETPVPQQKAKEPKPTKAKVEEPKKPERKGKGDNDRRPRGGKGDRSGEKSHEAYDGADKPQKPGDHEGRGKGARRRYDDSSGESRGKGKGKGRGGRREYDRHSSTGRGKGESRDGRGANRGWGEQTEGQTETETDKPEQEKTQETEAPAPVPEPEEEDNTMTLEEYMKQQSEKNASLPSFNERKIEDSGEGFKVNRDTEKSTGSTDELYGMVFHAYDGKDKSQEEKHGREGWVVADDILNIKFAEQNFAPAGGKGDRGGRDDRRGKGGKKGGKAGGNRSNNGGGRKAGGGPQQGKIELDNANMFPSLS